MRSDLLVSVNGAPVDSMQGGNLALLAAHVCREGTHARQRLDHARARPRAWTRQRRMRGEVESQQAGEAV